MTRDDIAEIQSPVSGTLENGAAETSDVFSERWWMARRVVSLDPKQEFVYLLLSEDREQLTSSLTILQGALETMVAKWRDVDAIDANVRGYVEAWNTYQVCANELSAALTASPRQEKKDDLTRSPDSQYGVLTSTRRPEEKA